jgi:uncharacterized membrane protein (UPF0127 family)
VPPGRGGWTIEEVEDTLRRVVLALVAALAVACSRQEARPTASARITGGREPVALRVEVADSVGERRSGLMARRSLAADAGMVFLYAEAHNAAFWMKDTTIPLSIAWFDADGRILRIVDMEPCRRDPCPPYRPGVEYHGALEVRRGSFREWGVGAGDVVSIDR